jgi:hypothetical protein
MPHEAAAAALTGMEASDARRSSETIPRLTTLKVSARQAAVKLARQSPRQTVGGAGPGAGSAPAAPRTYNAYQRSRQGP